MNKKSIGKLLLGILLIFGLSVSVLEAKAEENESYYAGENTVQKNDVKIDENNFPDETFRQHVQKNFDKDKDEILEIEESRVVTYLNFSKNYSITSLKGIEYFTKLTILWCDSNQLTSLDVSKNEALTHLVCNNNKLTSLDVSNCKALVVLDCSGNQLTSLDVSANKALAGLDCSGNQLMSLDVSNCRALTNLDCSSNLLMSLDVSKNEALTNLDCNNNKVTSLDVSNCKALTDLSCDSNQLASLDVSKNAKLTTLNCNWNTGRFCPTEKLSDLPGFDSAKASNWSNEVFDTESGNLTEGIDSGTITYDYDCGNEYSRRFSLVVSHYDDDADVCCDVCAEQMRLFVYRQIDEDSCHLSGYNGIETTVNIPSVLDGYEVIGMDPGVFYENRTLESVVIPGTVKIIPKYAFASCSNLKHVTLPEGLIGIDENAFDNCDSLSSISIPDSVISLHEACFRDCDSLVDIKFGKNLRTIGLNCFWHCDKLTSVTLSNNLQEIYTGAFADNPLLCSIIVPPSVSFISGGACDNWKSITIYGLSGSYAESFANDIGATFVEPESPVVESVSLSKSEIEIVVESSRLSSHQLQVKIEPESFLHDVIWKSSDTDVATVTEQGKVTAVAEGTAIISVTVGEQSASCKVMVKREEASSIDLNETSLLLVINDTFALTASCNGQVIWSSSDESIATVAKDGLVTALAVGSTTITATAMDGSGVSASCTVTVLAEPPLKVEINEENFPDEAFRKALLEKYDERKDGILEEDEILKIKDLYVRSLGISDLTGIEYFTKLENLFCSGNNLTSLDVSGLSLLELLECGNNDLESLNVSGLSSLCNIYCEGNKLSSLDLSGLSSLKYLYCYQNNLESLDASGSSLLQELVCDSNNLSSLNVSGLSSLVKLSCLFNNLSSLDTSGLSSLEWLQCRENNLSSLDLSGLNLLYFLDCGGNKLSSLDVSTLQALSTLICSENKLSSLDVSGLSRLRQLDCNTNKLSSLNASGLSLLEELYCSENNLSSLNVSSCTKLRVLGCSENKLSSLDVGGLSSLVNLVCSENQLSSLDVSGSSLLVSLSCHKNNLSSLDVSNLSLLEELSCSSNNLSSLDVSGLSSLERLYCSYNNSLGSLDVSDLCSLKELKCVLTGISTLDVSNNNLLQVLYCDGNSLSSLDVRSLVQLKELTCSYNNLESLDVSDLSSLTILNCEYNNLSSLNVDGLSSLKNLTCGHNNLSSLNISGLSSYGSLSPLERLDCSENQLSSLDVSNLSSLQVLYCDGNSLNSLDVSQSRQLKTLECSLNNITNLNVSGLHKLEILYCSDNQIESLDLSGMSLLEDIMCYNNCLTSLDVSDLHSLKYLFCFNNNLSSLDVSGCESISEVFVGGNEQTICVDGEFLLSDLSGFDASRASNWTGAEYDAKTNSLKNITGAISYEYDCGKGFSETFQLVIGHVDTDGDMLCDTCKDTLPLSQVEPVKAFVYRMYTLILERPADSGLEYWVGELKSGAKTGAEVAAGFVLSEEFLGKEMTNAEYIQIMYQTFFGREADEGGLAWWLDAMENGTSKQVAFAGFVNSDEFDDVCAEYGITRGTVTLPEEQEPEEPTVSQFVKRLYSEIMGRDADEGGLSYWVGELEGQRKSGAEAAGGFILSEEFQGKEMTNAEYIGIMYRTFFGRNADEGGLAWWLDAMENGESKWKVFAGFANSDEFGTLCETYGIIQGSITEPTEDPAPAPTVSEFVKRLYSEIMGRDADEGGLSYWVGELEGQRTTGAEAAAGFILSEEFQAREMTDAEYIGIMYKTFFGREADEGGLAWWLDAMENGTSKFIAFAGFANSEEFGELCEMYGIEQGSVTMQVVIDIRR